MGNVRLITAGLSANTVGAFTMPAVACVCCLPAAGEWYFSVVEGGSALRDDPISLEPHPYLGEKCLF
jgi:hypothetical protein